MQLGQCRRQPRQAPVEVGAAVVEAVPDLADQGQQRQQQGQRRQPPGDEDGPIGERRLPGGAREQSRVAQAGEQRSAAGGVGILGDHEVCGRIMRPVELVVGEGRDLGRRQG